MLDSYVRWGEPEPLVQKGAEIFEHTLDQLDSIAWDEFVKRVLPHSCMKDGTYGWRQYYSHLNEARGYVLLKNRRYSNIHFLPESGKERGAKSAEIIGGSSDSFAIVEVKTINLSNDEIERTRKRLDPTFSVAKKMGKELRPGDIKDVQAFAKKLIGRSDPVSAWLLAQLDKQTQESLVNLADDTKQAESKLVDDLNKIIKGPCIYEKERFREVCPHFQDLTRYLFRDQFADTVCLNRCLLDDAYPEELSKWSSCMSVVELGFRQDAPIPAKLKEKMEKTIETAQGQITGTLERLPIADFSKRDVIPSHSTAP